jgi:preprotein translocase subunit SecG
VEPIDFVDFFPKAFFGSAQAAARTTKVMLLISFMIMLLFGLLQTARMNKYLLDKNRSWFQYAIYFCKGFIFSLVIIFIQFSIFIAVLQIEGRNPFDRSQNIPGHQSQERETQPSGK